MPYGNFTTSNLRQLRGASRFNVNEINIGLTIPGNWSFEIRDRYRVPEFPHSSATFNIISGFRILASPKVLQGALGDSTCPTQCSQPCPMPANRHLTGLTWFPIVLYYIK